MTKVKDVAEFINSLAPFDTKAQWDNCGLLVGDAESEVKKIGFCLDLTVQTLQEAKKNGVNLVVTHHPVIFKAQKSFLCGNMAYELARNGMSVICAHTCYDSAQGGVNDVLSGLLRLKNVETLSEEQYVEPLLRIGNTDETDAESFSQFVAKQLCTCVGLSDSGKKIKRVAVCSGAGGDLWNIAYDAGADAFVTGEARHNELIDALNVGMTVITAGHFETENPAMSALERRVTKEFEAVQSVILKQDNPVKYIG